MYLNLRFEEGKSLPYTLANDGKLPGREVNGRQRRTSEQWYSKLDDCMPHPVRIARHRKFGRGGTGNLTPREICGVPPNFFL